jgi:hypothetical protein
MKLRGIKGAKQGKTDEKREACARTSSADTTVKSELLYGDQFLLFGNRSWRDCFA